MKKRIILRNVLITAMLILLMSVTDVYAQNQNDNLSIDDTTQMEQKTLKHDYDTKYDTEVTLEDMPQEVTEAIQEAYGGHEIGKILQGSDGSFKVVLEDDNEKLAAFYSINGKLLRVEKNEEGNASDEE